MAKEENLKKQVDITVSNQLVKGERDINVYHHARRTAHLISCGGVLTSRITAGEADDYLHISVVSGPGYLENECVMDLPSFMNFRFRTTGEVIFDHSGERLVLRVPPGPPAWELRMNVSKRLSPAQAPAGDQVVIGDEEVTTEPPKEGV